jgi:hypothetical protein
MTDCMACRPSGLIALASERQSLIHRRQRSILASLSLIERHFPHQPVAVQHLHGLAGQEQIERTKRGRFDARLPPDKARSRWNHSPFGAPVLPSARSTLDLYVSGACCVESPSCRQLISRPQNTSRIAPSGPAIRKSVIASWSLLKTTARWRRGPDARPSSRNVVRRLRCGRGQRLREANPFCRLGGSLRSLRPPRHRRLALFAAVVLGWIRL